MHTSPDPSQRPVQGASGLNNGPLRNPSAVPGVASPGSELLGNVHVSHLARGIHLHVCPGKEISWEDFLRVVPRGSVALDGLVRGAPKFSEEHLCANFNHHQDVDRLATRSTAGQVLIAIKQRLMDRFKEGGSLNLHVFVNDPDQDSALAVWLLANHERVLGTRSEPTLSKLVFAEDLLDTTAGAYPFEPDSSLMRELAWIFEPYVEARVSGRIRLMQGAEMANVIDAVGLRISRYSLGERQEVELDTRLEVVGGGKYWGLIREQGFYARTGLFAKGIHAFVSILEESDGCYHYSIGKMSPFIPFPITKIYAVLNEREGLDSASGVCWGGGDTIGGSPRRVGSKLSPREVEEIINALLGEMVLSQ